MSRREGCAVVAVHGELRTATLPQLYDGLHKGSRVGGGLVVDLSGARTVSRAACAALRATARELRTADRPVVVAGLAPDAVEADSGLLGELEPCADLATAVRRAVETGPSGAPEDRDGRRWALGFRHGRTPDVSTGRRREHRRDAGRQRAGTTPEP